MGASSKTTAGLMTDPAQGNHTQSNLKEFFNSRPRKIVQESRLIKENSLLLVQVRRASSTVGNQCGRVVSWLENEDLPQCHRGGERSEILKPAERRHLVELPASQYNL